jgi:receptor tyrosine kinase
VGPLDEYTHVKLPEYNRDKLIYICDLGEGHFGLVIRAEAPDIMSQEPNSTVAVKVLKEGASSATKTEFFREASLMAGFNHPNILKLLGVCIEQEPLCMIFEYMEMGDLNNFLRENAPPYLHSFPCTGPKTLPDRLSVKGLVDISKDIAAGLAYLSKNHYVHRDLATRNCLVNKALRVKIADFGLSQDVYSNDYFRLGDSELLPVRWMPPEAILYSKFTICSDIWSFGVVLWETFSYGIQPYYGMSNEEVVQYVRECNVLKCPQKCPQEIYDLMLDCWNIDPQERPKAYEISEGLDKWTPDLSAQLEVQTRHPDYQNMSTILEWARRSRETGNYYLLEDPNNQNGDVNQNGGTSMLEADNHVENGNKKMNGNYDHLKPVEEETDKENVNKINIY